MENTFEVCWQAADGYAGGARPHYTTIRAEDFDYFEDMSEDDIKEVIHKEVYNDFLQTVDCSYDQDPVIEWAKSHQPPAHKADATSEQ